MLKYDQFRQLKEWRKLGLSQYKVSANLSISIRQVRKYWDMENEDFYRLEAPIERGLEYYREFILDILRACPQIQGNQCAVPIKRKFSGISI